MTPNPETLIPNPVWCAVADFLKAVEKTLSYEGGLASDPNDPGGLTNFGISLRAHPELTPADIQTMTRQRAIGIYRGRYWFESYSEIADQAIANTLFDFGVTSGVQTAVKILQIMLYKPALLDGCRFDFISSGVGCPPDVDGHFGDATLYSVNVAAQRALRVAYVAARLSFYCSIGKANYLRSWFSRSIDALLE